MADHPELVAEIPKVEKMTVQERLEYAKKRRSQQLRRWERNKDPECDPPPKKKARKPYKARFEPGVMLLESSSRGDSLEVRKLLETGVDPNLGNDDGLTALHQACIDDNEDIVELLLRFGANVDSVDKELWTPLHAAAACGNIDVVDYLVEQGANIVAINADGNIPLDLVEEDEDLKNFLKEEMDSKGYTEEKLEELRQATEMSMLEDVRLKVENDDDLDEKDHLGATPLHIGAANGYDEVVEFLLENGADIEAVDNDGWQPIHAAACWGQEKIIELLVIHGADLEIRTPEGETPYDLCEDSEVRAYIKELKKQVKTNKLMLKESRKKRRNSRTLSVKRTSLKEKINISQNEAKAEAILRQHPQLAFLIPNASKITNGDSQARADTNTQSKMSTEPVPGDHMETKQTMNTSLEGVEAGSDQEHKMMHRHPHDTQTKLDSVIKDEKHSKHPEKEIRTTESHPNDEQGKSVVTTATHQDRRYASSKERSSFDQGGKFKAEAVGPIPDHPPPRRSTLPGSDESTKTDNVSSDVRNSLDQDVTPTCHEKFPRDTPNQTSGSFSSSQSTTVSITSSSRTTTVSTRETSQTQQNELATTKTGVTSRRAQGRELPTLNSKSVGQQTGNRQSSGATSEVPREDDVLPARSGSTSHSVFTSLDTSTSGYPESFHSRRDTGDKPRVRHPVEDSAVQKSKLLENNKKRTSLDASEGSRTEDNRRGTATSEEVTEINRPKQPTPTTHKKRQAPAPPVKEQKMPQPSPKDNTVASPGDVSISTDRVTAHYRKTEEKENSSDLPKDSNTSEATNNKTPVNDQVKIVRQKKSCCTVM